MFFVIGPLTRTRLPAEGGGKRCRYITEFLPVRPEAPTGVHMCPRVPIQISGSSRSALMSRDGNVAFDFSLVSVCVRELEAS